MKTHSVRLPPLRPRTQLLLLPPPRPLALSNQSPRPPPRVHREVNRKTMSPIQLQLLSVPRTSPRPRPKPKPLGTVPAMTCFVPITSRRRLKISRTTHTPRERANFCLVTRSTGNDVTFGDLPLPLVYICSVSEMYRMFSRGRCYCYD